MTCGLSCNLLKTKQNLRVSRELFSFIFWHQYLSFSWYVMLIWYCHPLNNQSVLWRGVMQVHLCWCNTCPHRKKGQWIGKHKVKRGKYLYKGASLIIVKYSWISLSGRWVTLTSQHWTIVSCYWMTIKSHTKPQWFEYENNVII